MSIKKELASLPTDDRALRNFGLLVGAAFVLFGAILLYFGKKWGIYLFVPAAPLILLGAIWPRALKQVYRVWMTLALAMGTVMTALLLSVFFFLVITPVGLFFRLIGRDILKRKFDRQATTYWIPKEYPIADRTRYEKFF